jgi:hypothetical protein
MYPFLSVAILENVMVLYRMSTNEPSKAGYVKGAGARDLNEPPK